MKLKIFFLRTFIFSFRMDTENVLKPFNDEQKHIREYSFVNIKVLWKFQSDEFCE
jgi:hypothetical protein